jgi:thiol-disulfide isomerase/thioredoxin
MCFWVIPRDPHHSFCAMNTEEVCGFRSRRHCPIGNCGLHKNSESSPQNCYLETKKMTTEPNQESAPEVAASEDQVAIPKEKLIGIMYTGSTWTPPHSWKVLFAGFAMFLIVGLVWYGIDKRTEMWRLSMDSVVEPEPLKAGIDAPDFTLPEGPINRATRLSQQQGKWVFINFWATWCPPCRDEMPSMEMLNRRFKDKLEVLALTVDEDWNEVERFFGDDKPTFKVLWDRNKNTSKMYGTKKFPESFLISPEGKVVVKFVGPRDWYNVGTVQYFDDILSGRRNPNKS